MDLAIGDESTPGYDPKALNNRTVSKSLSKALGVKTLSKGMKGASLTLKNKGNLLHQLSQFSLPAYDRIFLFYGSNDYLKSKAGLGKISKVITKAIQTIRKKNHWLKIYGILPLPMYDKKGNSLINHRGPGLYTLHDLMAMIGITYANNDVACLDWMTLSAPIISLTNYKQRLTDGRYPKPVTYQLMAERISSFVNRKDADGYGKENKLQLNDFSMNNGKSHKRPVIHFGD